MFFTEMQNQPNAATSDPPILDLRSSTVVSDHLLEHWSGGCFKYILSAIHKKCNYSKVKEERNGSTFVVAKTVQEYKL